jgi:hypothetical protein
VTFVKVEREMDNEKDHFDIYDAVNVGLGNQLLASRCTLYVHGSKKPNIAASARRQEIRIQTYFSVL